MAYETIYRVYLKLLSNILGSKMTNAYTHSISFHPSSDYLTSVWGFSSWAATNTTVSLKPSQTLVQSLQLSKKVPAPVVVCSNFSLDLWKHTLAATLGSGGAQCAAIGNKCRRVAKMLKDYQGTHICVYTVYQLLKTFFLLNVHMEKAVFCFS